MSDSATIYDLMLLLDLGAEDDARAKIVADARAAIEADGTLLGDQAWGVRPLAYPIDHRNQAEYHLLQFSGPPSLIASLEHTLRITDGVDPPPRDQAAGRGDPGPGRDARAPARPRRPRPRPRRRRRGAPAAAEPDAELVGA